MQRLGEQGRVADATAVGRGVEGFARAFAALKPDWVVVLGDRIEAFAAASAASIGGLALAHVHGGDRAEGIADESMRHAISKLSHVHMAATEESALRLVRMGEPPAQVHVIGSPALDELAGIEPMTDVEAHVLGDPRAVFLMHPSGLAEADERAMVRSALHATAAAYRGHAVLCLSPNRDAGREWVEEEIETFRARVKWPKAGHLPRATFVALLKRLASSAHGLIVGNSSAGLIECAVLKLPAVNVGPRQAGRERAANVVDAPSGDSVSTAIARALTVDRAGITHPYGAGQAGIRAAALLSALDPRSPGLLRKRCAY